MHGYLNVKYIYLVTVEVGGIADVWNYTSAYFFFWGVT